MIRFLLALAALFAASACTIIKVPSVQMDEQRTYRVHVPDNVPSQGAALVLALHGFLNTPDIITLTTMHETSNKYGFIVAYPRGQGEMWSDGVLRDFAPDDVKFLKTVVSDVRERYAAIDPKRVYVVGVSNGGMMSLRLACEAADVFAGVAAVSASIGETIKASCRPQRPIKVMLINGTGDPMVPYTGGNPKFLVNLRVFNRVADTDETYKFFAGLNGCGQALPTPTIAPGITVATMGGCAERVRLVRIQDGGHGWPGGLQFLPVPIIGDVRQDVDAGDLMWRFFNE